ncbi:MAG: hypothetical protein ACRC14_15865, partial [Paracoccaceae bacterium]
MDRLRAKLRQVFELDSHPLHLVSSHSEPAGPITVSRLAFATALGEAVRGICCRPADISDPCPAALMIHAHGNR